MNFRPEIAVTMAHRIAPTAAAAAPARIARGNRCSAPSCCLKRATLAGSISRTLIDGGMPGGVILGEDGRTVIVTYGRPGQDHTTGAVPADHRPLPERRAGGSGRRGRLWRRWLGSCAGASSVLSGCDNRRQVGHRIDLTYKLLAIVGGPACFSDHSLSPSSRTISAAAPRHSCPWPIRSSTSAGGAAAVVVFTCWVRCQSCCSKLHLLERGNLSQRSAPRRSAYQRKSATLASRRRASSSRGDICSMS